MMSAAQRAAWIRSVILASTGAVKCQRAHCEVITQGGQAGYRDHMRVVHGSTRGSAPKEAGG